MRQWYAGDEIVGRGRIWMIVFHRLAQYLLVEGSLQNISTVLECMFENGTNQC